MTSRAYGARSPRSHYYVILTVTSFATELATPTVTDVRTDTLPRLIYREDFRVPVSTDFYLRKCLKSCQLRVVQFQCGANHPSIGYTVSQKRMLTF